MYFSFLLVMFNSGMALSDASFNRIGVPMLKSAVLRSFLPVPASSECPEGGSKSYDNVAEEQAGLMSAKSTVTNLIESARVVAKIYVNETVRCGSCKQINQVSIYTTSEPANVSVDSSCERNSAEGIQKSMPDKDISSFVEAVVSGKTSDGQRIYAACPDPCSLYTASAVIPAANNNVLLNLVVQCGQPRNGSLFFAKYKFTAGIIHKWTCQK